MQLDTLKDNMKIFKIFKWYDYLLAVLVVGFIICQVILEMRLIEIMGELIGVIQKHYTFNAPLQMSDIYSISGKMLLVAAGILGCIIIVNFLSNYIAAGYAKRLRKSVFEKVESFSREQIDKFSTASLITRSTNDITQLQNTVQMTLKMAITAPTMAIFALNRIVGSSVTLSLSTGIALAVMLIFIIVTFVLIAPKFSAVQKKTDRINLVTRENLTGIRAIRAFNAEDVQQGKFEKANDSLTKTNLFISKVASFMMPGMMLIMNGLSLVIYWLGATLINTGDLEYYMLITFSQYSMHVLMSFMFISMLFIMLPRGIASAKRINEILKEKITIVDGCGADQNKKASVEFKNVSFKYPDAENEVLSDISFKAGKGETVAFIGSTGSGKSTLINLIPRLFDVTSGSVLVNGKDVRDYKINKLNEILSYIPQKAVLFSETLRENVAYGDKDISDEDIISALKTAQAEDFYSSLKEGLDYNIGRNGSNVSGGQKQRICIARAIARKPQIYIFDDSFSALDYKTDKNLRAELKTKTSDVIKLIVAQRIGTVIDADKIIVLNEGKMVGQGTHSELMKNCAVYKEIALSQLSKEELSNENN